MRNENQLLKILYDNLEDLMLFNSGLCGCIRWLFSTGKITFGEHLFLISVINKNKPKDIISPYWWKPHCLEPRKEFLENLLNLYLPKDSVKTKKSNG